MLRKFSTAMAVAIVAMVLFSAVFDVQLQPLAEAARRFYVQSVSAGDSSVVVAGTTADPTVAVANGGITTDKLADGAVTPAKLAGGSFVNSVSAADGSITVGGSAGDPTLAVTAEGLGNAHFADEALAQSKLAKPTSARVSLTPPAIGLAGWQDVQGISLNFSSLGRPLTFACQASVVSGSPTVVDFRVLLDGVAVLTQARTSVSSSDFRNVALNDVVPNVSAGAHSLKLQAMMSSPTVLMFSAPASCAALEH